MIVPTHYNHIQKDCRHFSWSGEFSHKICVMLFPFYNTVCGKYSILQFLVMVFETNHFNRFVVKTFQTNLIKNNFCKILFEQKNILISILFQRDNMYYNPIPWYRFIVDCRDSFFNATVELNSQIQNEFHLFLSSCTYSIFRWLNK